jgi:hypothetical protein
LGVKPYRLWIRAPEDADADRLLAAHPQTAGRARVILRQAWSNYAAARLPPAFFLSQPGTCELLVEIDAGSEREAFGALNSLGVEVLPPVFALG